MKKSLYFLAAGAILLSACNNDDPVVPAGANGDGNVSFTVTMPGNAIGSRSFGDGLSADYLQYAVYDKQGKLVLNGEQQFGGSLSTTVTLSLVKGVSYDVAFFAQNKSDNASDKAYTFDYANHTITVDYSKMEDYNSKDHEVFYKLLTDVTANYSSAEPVQLVRPVAQINWGTNDLDELTVADIYGANAADLMTSVNVKGVHNTLDVLSGATSASEGFDGEVTFAALARPDADAEKFPVDGFEYLSMGYILVPSDNSSVVDLNMSVLSGDKLIDNVTVTNAPVQGNFRTNIYGRLLTSAVDIFVDKDPTWGDPDNEPLIWDGTVVEPTEGADGVYTITTPAELAGLAKLVNNGNYLTGKTVKLMNDIDLNNIEWTPIGNDDDNEKGFGGTFDGQGRTISNLYIHNAKSAAGLFGYSWKEATIKNVKIDGVDINVLSTMPSMHANGALFGSGKAKLIENVSVNNAKFQTYRRTGAIAGSIYGSVKNCVATNIEITLSYELVGSGVNNGDKAGAIVGYYPGEGNYTFSGNSAYNVTITGGRDLGALVGYAGNTKAYAASNNKVFNGTVNQVLTDELYGDDGNQTKINPAKFASVNALVGYDGAGTFAAAGNNLAFNVEVNRGDLNVDAPEDVIAAIANGLNIKVAPNKELDLSSATAEQLTINNPTTIEVAEGSTVNLGSNVLTVTDKLTLKGAPVSRGRSMSLQGGTLTNVNSEPTAEYGKALIIIRGGELIIDNMELINDMDYHRHGSTINCGAIHYYNDSKITITNSVIKSGEFTLCGYGSPEVNTSELILKDSYFESTSSSKNGTGNWSYNMRLNGKTALLENCEVKGVQGGVSPNWGCTVTIKSGKYYTVNSEKGDDAYYPVYVTNNATAIIEGGEFIGARNLSRLCEGTSCVVSGDNDTDKPSGDVIIKGGKFSGKAYNHVTNSVYQADQWVALENEGDLKWTIQQ